MDRRAFTRSVGGGSVLVSNYTVGSSPVLAQQNGDDDGGDGNGATEPAWPEFVKDANNFDGTTDNRGQEEVTVDVGAGPESVSFDSPAIWIDQGATVIWEWTGEGGSHNVITEEGPAALESELAEEAGFTYEHAFEEVGITSYFCEPHVDLGMIGGVAAGEDIETREVAAGGEALEPDELGVHIREHYVGLAAVVSIIISIIFAFFVLKYAESSHASGGRRR